MGYHFSSQPTVTLNLCLLYFKITWILIMLLEHMHKKFEINRTKFKGSCQSGRKMVPHDSKSDSPLILDHFQLFCIMAFCPLIYHRIPGQQLNNLVFCLNLKMRQSQAEDFYATDFLHGLDERFIISSLIQRKPWKKYQISALTISWNDWLIPLFLPHSWEDLFFKHFA